MSAYFPIGRCGAVATVETGLSFLEGRVPAVWLSESELDQFTEVVLT